MKLVIESWVAGFFVVLSCLNGIRVIPTRHTITLLAKTGAEDTDCCKVLGSRIDLTSDCVSAVCVFWAR